jgi:hypothetical protein
MAKARRAIIIIIMDICQVIVIVDVKGEVINECQKLSIGLKLLSDNSDGGDRDDP